MPEVKKKGAKRSSNPNRNAPMLQATVLIYLKYHKFALQDHLLSACVTSAFYLNNYILPHLLKQKQIKKEEARKTKEYRLTDTGKVDAQEIIEHIEKKTAIGTSSWLAGINLDELRNL